MRECPILDQVNRPNHGFLAQILCLGKPPWCFLAACAVLFHVHGAEVDLMPVSGGDGAYTQVTVAGQVAWQNTGEANYLYCARPESFSIIAGQTLYVRATYYDGQGGGLIGMQYDSQTAAYTTSQLHTRTSRVGSGRFVDCYFELPNVLFNKRQNNSSDFRLICGDPGGVYVSVSRITLSDAPFPDPDFQTAVARAWQSRYTGPAKDYVDPTTLKGKVMTGYQGWFNTPNDLKDGGWRHWVRNNTATSENFQIDAWPDVSEYDPAALVRAGNVMTASGEPAYLFSSATYSVVHQHFRWMRKHNIDGAWLQRFHPKAGGETEWPLRNVSQAAAEEGLVWGVEYDVSGMADATVAAKLQADWEWLTTQFDILNDPRYIHEDGKPVVFIWGLAVPDRLFTPASANAVVDYFKAQGVHVLGGIPNIWSTLSADWQAHMAKYDGVSVWRNQNTSDATFFRNRGQDFYPHDWPGFSWAHLKKQVANPPTQYEDRTGGQYFWTKGQNWINAGPTSNKTDSLFIGMFDEYDEATHIMPMTDDAPDPHTLWGRFLDNQGKPSDWWMMLTDELKRMMLGQRTNTDTLPTVESLANRSNIGSEASVDLGATDINESLTRVPNNGDGNTVVETVGGKQCRGNVVLATDRYMYFNVDNAFAHQPVNGDVTIEVEYYDSFYGTGAGTVLGLQYDSTSSAYTNHLQLITTTGSNTWRRVRFEISDAYFGGRQNGGADFRLNFNGKKINVNRVWVRLPEGKFYPFTWNNATAGSALDWSQGANWLGGIVGQSDPTSSVRFFPGQTMQGGTVPITNNLAGQVFNQLQLGGTASTSADTTVTLGGNALSLGGTAPSISLVGAKTAFGLTYEITAPVTLLETAQVGGDGDAVFRLSGVIDGTGGITKTGASALTLHGANSYTGDTTINAGTLSFGQANTANDASTVTIAATGATLDLNFSGTDTVHKLFIGGVPQAAGEYGPSATDITQITGSGTLTVTSGPITDFATWINGNFVNGAANGQDPNDDGDGDGIHNLIEYALIGQDPTVPNPSVGTFTDGTLSFTKRAGTSGLTYAIQESTDLGITDTWDEVIGGTYTNNASTISYTLPASPNPKNFLRLRVTQP